MPVGPPDELMVTVTVLLTDAVRVTVNGLVALEPVCVHDSLPRLLPQLMVMVAVPEALPTIYIDTVQANVPDPELEKLVEPEAAKI